MDLVHYLILVAGGFAGGFINILIGGGGLIILPVYMGAGLSASMANGTNRVNLFMQYIIATIKFSRNGKMPWKLVITLGIPTAIGTIVGALLATNISNEILHLVLLGIIIFSIVYISLNKNMKMSKCNCPSVDTPVKVDWLTWAMFLIAGVYAGFISVAIGMIWFALCNWRLKLGYVRITAIRIFLGLVISSIALTIFAISGKINLIDGLVLGIGSSSGAYLASVVALKLNKKLIKIIMLAILALAGCYMLFFQILHWM